MTDHEARTLAASLRAAAAVIEESVKRKTIRWLPEVIAKATARQVAHLLAAMRK